MPSLFFPSFIHNFLFNTMNLNWLYTDLKHGKIISSMDYDLSYVMNTFEKLANTSKMSIFKTRLLSNCDEIYNFDMIDIANQELPVLLDTCGSYFTHCLTSHSIRVDTSTTSLENI